MYPLKEGGQPTEPKMKRQNFNSDFYSSVAGPRLTTSRIRTLPVLFLIIFAGLFFLFPSLALAVDPPLPGWIQKPHGSFLIVVNENLFADPGVQDAIYRYADDLKKQGFQNVIIKTWKYVKPANETKYSHPYAPALKEYL